MIEKKFSVLRGFLSCMSPVLFTAENVEEERRERRLFFLVIVHDTLDTVFKNNDMKVDEQADL